MSIYLLVCLLIIVIYIYIHVWIIHDYQNFKHILLSFTSTLWVVAMDLNLVRSLNLFCNRLDDIRCSSCDIQIYNQSLVWITSCIITWSETFLFTYKEEIFTRFRKTFSNNYCPHTSSNVWPMHTFVILNHVYESVLGMHVSSIWKKILGKTIN